MLATPQPTTAVTRNVLSTTNYQQFKQGPLKDAIQHKFSDYSTNLLSGNAVIQIYAKPKQPTETDVSMHPVTGTPTTRLAYSREPTTEDTQSLFDMEMTSAGRAMFQAATNKFYQDDIRNRTEYEAAKKIDSALLQTLLELLSPQTQNQLELHKNWNAIFDTSKQGIAPQRAHDLFAIMEDTFNKPDAAGISHGIKHLMEFKREPTSQSAYEHLAQVNKLISVVIQSLDPHGTGLLSAADFKTAMIINSFNNTDVPAEKEAIRIILKMPTPKPVSGRTPLLLPHSEIIDIITKELSITTTSPDTTSPTHKALIVTGTNSLNKPTIFDPKTHCKTCYDINKVISTHPSKYCRTKKKAEAAAAAAATTATTTTTGAKALITTTTPAVADAPASVTTTATAHAAEIARLNAMYESQREIMQSQLNNQQETLRGLIGSISTNGSI